MRGAARIAASLVLAAMLASCGPRAAIRPACPAGKACLEYGNGSEPVSLDPAKITGTWEDRIVGEMLVGLTQDDPQGRPAPAMAERWETSADGKRWTFHLRRALWSDGVPVTAGDFVFAMRRLMEPKTASEYAYLLFFIRNAEAVNDGKLPPEALGVRAIDDRTLEIDLTHPAPYLLEVAKHETMYPAPEHAVRRWGEHWTDPAHYVANGPYRLVSWRLGDHIRLTKNPLYYDAAKVCIDQVDFYPTTDPIAAERRVRRGELDVSSDILSNRVHYLEQPDQMAAYVRVHTYLGVSYLVFNTRDVAAFRDRRVRLALDMTVDRAFITQKLERDGRLPAYTFVPPGTDNYAAAPLPVWAAWPFERRQAVARALLAQAGYGPGHPLSFEYKHGDSPEALLIAPALQADWRTIGVHVTLAQEEGQIAYQDLRVRNFEMGAASWIADYNDATSFLTLLQSNTGAQNYGDYDNPAFDALLSAADNEPDAKVRAADLARAEQLMLDDAAIIPVSFFVNKALVNPKITGWVDNLTNWHRLQYLCVKRQP
ncbi:MAG TPA: peptide ABC transporter substrate-binding protein [Caulobacteraceae bacterium]|nr:peptide ABC transporter substrate-binding protein [Caulobacteraceae bacterium]